MKAERKGKRKNKKEEPVEPGSLTAVRQGLARFQFYYASTNLAFVLIHHSPPDAPPLPYFENAATSLKHPALPPSSSGHLYTTPSASDASLLISHAESPHKRYGNAFQTGTTHPILTTNDPSQWVSCSLALSCPGVRNSEHKAKHSKLQHIKKDPAQDQLEVRLSVALRTPLVNIADGPGRTRMGLGDTGGLERDTVAANPQS